MATPLIDYLEGGAAITPTEMNTLFGAWNAKLSRLFGGRSFMLGNRDGSSTGGGTQIGGGSYFRFPGVPYRLFGKCFYFTAGQSAYWNQMPGPILINSTTVDPITLGTVATTHAVRPYNHTPFTDAAAAAVVSSYDSATHIATIPTIPAGSPYYTNGLAHQPGISLFDHSLEAHTVEHLGETYWLKEALCPIAEKVYNFGLAEIIIEGVTSVGMDVCVLSNFKYKNLRFHNLQHRDCEVTLPDGNTMTLTPFECQSWRLNVAGTAFVQSSMRYFQEFRGTDPRLFWFWPTLPSNAGAGTSYEICLTPASAQQGNNLSNPAGQIYDFAAWLNDPTDTLRHASLNRNVHELCDMSAVYKNKFACFNSDGSLRTDAKIGDMFHHKGKLLIKKVSTTLYDPRDPTNTIRLVTKDEVDFRGYDTIVADFAAKGITVTAVGGNLQFKNNDPAWSVDLISWTTNLLKGITYNPLKPWQVRTGININAGLLNEIAIFENAAGGIGTLAEQPTLGTDSFTWLPFTNYRISQKLETFVVPNPSRAQWMNESNVAQSVFLPSYLTITDTLVGAAKSLTGTGIHAVTVADLLTLKWFGNAALASQDDAWTTYEGAALTLTPEGWVLTFTEILRADFVATQTDSFTNYAGNKFFYDEDTNTFRFKHAIRFRGHGFGWGQFGKDNVAFLGPHEGRAQVAGYTNEVNADAGADFGFPNQMPRQSAVKFLRQFDLSELTNATPGGRFLQVGKQINLDGLLAFEHSDENWLWYPVWRGTITSTNSDAPKLAREASGLVGNGTDHIGPYVPRLLAMPLLTGHYNAMAQLVNQCDTGRLLDWRSLRIPYGAQVLDFNAVKGGAGVFRYWSDAGATGNQRPMPFSAFGQLLAGSEYWEHFFTHETNNLVQIRRVNDMPGFPAFRNQINQKCAVLCDWTASVANVTWSAGVGVNRWNFFGDVTFAISNIRFGPDMAFGVPPTESGPDTAWMASKDANETLNFTNFWSEAVSTTRIALSVYDPVKWVSVDDFKALLAIYGMPCMFVERVIPLTLDWAEIDRNTPPTDPPGVTNNASVTRVGDQLLLNQFSTTPATFAANLPTTWNNSGTIAYGNTVANVPRKFPVWRLCNTELEASVGWKFPARANMVCFNPDNRTFGLWKNEAQIGVFGTIGMLKFPAFHLGVSRTTGLLGVDSTTSGPGYHPPLQNTSPWYPVDILPNVAGGQPYSFRLTAGPRKYLYFPIPVGATEQQRQDNHAAMACREKDWQAINLVSNDPDATIQVHTIPVATAARNKDWWNSLDGYLSSMRGSYLTIYQVGAVKGSAPLRLVNPTTYGTVDCAEGITLLKPGLDESYRVLYDPARRLVAL